ncbi:unnamed protein product [Arabidopsis lyrata]|nr:unnamed protein product [Arabidopsis lyrata]
MLHHDALLFSGLVGEEQRQNQTSNKLEPKINNSWNLKKSKMKSNKRIEKPEHEIAS